MSRTPPADAPRGALLYETHAHTHLCRHARGEPDDYVAAALRRGLRGLVFTCHCPLPDGHSHHVRMRPEEFPIYIELVAATRERWRHRLDVRLGMESDFVPGLEPHLRDLHASAPFDYLIGSVHPQLFEYRRAFFRGDWLEFQRTYFRHLADAAETGLYDSISHPDLIKNEAPDQWDVERLLPHIGECLDRIAATGVAMELNTSGLNKLIPEMNPGPQILAEILSRRIPIVVGGDAHCPDQVGNRFDAAIDLLREIGFPCVHHFLHRTLQSVPIDLAAASLRPQPPGPTG